jgi:hypothetical protein
VSSRAACSLSDDILLLAVPLLLLLLCRADWGIAASQHCQGALTAE